MAIPTRDEYRGWHRAAASGALGYVQALAFHAAIADWRFVGAGAYTGTLPDPDANPVTAAETERRTALVSWARSEVPRCPWPIAYDESTLVSVQGIAPPPERDEQGNLPLPSQVGAVRADAAASQASLMPDFGAVVAAAVRVLRHAPNAPRLVRRQAVQRLVEYEAELRARTAAALAAAAAGQPVMPPVGGDSFRRSGAAALLAPFRQHFAAVVEADD